MNGRNKKFIAELQKKPRLRKESGLYVIDGPKMAGETPAEYIEEIYITRDFLNSPNASDCTELLKSMPYSVITDAEMKQISDTVTPQGILVVARQRRFRGLGGFFEEERRYASALKGVSDAGNDIIAKQLLLILETIQDPGNLGTVIRAAEAAGATGIIADGGTADLYSPKTVRSTMGAMLRLPYIAVNDLNKAVTLIKAGEFTDGEPVRAYAAHLDGKKDYTSADFTGRTMVMIGNESRGLSDELAGIADEKIVIPMAGHTESLNAAMAAGVIVFEAARQRRIGNADTAKN